MPSSERQLFYMTLAELKRRHAGAPETAEQVDLTPYELSVYSQNGEDGVLAEIFRRIGSGRRQFVEFGIERGIEGNAVALADVFGWHGLFIEGDRENFLGLNWKYRNNPGVRTIEAMVSAENIDALLADNEVSREPDLLSIDVDGNDLWIWRSIRHAKPRVVVIEYNANLDQDRPLAAPYDPDWVWPGTDWYGASIAALEVVAAEQGYRFIHSDLAGVNTFFVRADLAHQFDWISAPPRRSQNFDGHGFGHRPHPGGGHYIELS